MSPVIEPGGDEEIRRRQRGRALVMALCLGGLVVLFYAVSIAKMA